MTPPRPPLLAARGLAFARNDEPIFGPLDFHVSHGEALLVEGDNGAGKTSLVRVLAGLLPAQAGEIRIEGQRLDRQTAAHHIALLGHLLGHKPELTALENLAFAAGVYGQRAGTRAEDCLAEAGLSGYEDQPVRMLSAGQKKRLALARLRLIPAPLWLLDEPYANLDLEGLDLVNRMVEAHLRAGGAALLTTHGAYAAPPVRTRMLELGGAP